MNYYFSYTDGTVKYQEDKFDEAQAYATYNLDEKTEKGFTQFDF